MLKDSSPFHVADSMQRNNFNLETEYVQAIAGWNEASNGRGLSQLERSRANHTMLNYILDESMSWHREIYDFSLLDINRYIVVHLFIYLLLYSPQL